MATKAQLLAAADERGLEGFNERSKNADIEAALAADGFDVSSLDADDDADEGDLSVDVSDVQEAMDTEHEQGFRGTKVDPTPNEAYTVAGVTSGQPTPETDPGLRAEARSRAFGELPGGQTKVTAEREPGESE